MSPEISRRTLLTAGATTLLTAALAGAVTAADTREGFVFPLIGDLHFDRLEHHDHDWLQKEKPNDVRQVANYSKITRDVTPVLFEEIRQQVAAQKISVPFVVHIGDLVEGLAGTPSLAQQQCRDAIAFVDAAKIGAPFLFCKGNHDVTGPGAVEAFDSILLPYLSAQARQTVTSTSFTVRQSDCLFIYFDAYHDPAGAGLDHLEKALAARGSARQIFLIIHPPVVPYDARSNWHIFARPSEAAARTRLLNLLGQHQVIVLCGHLHKYGTVVRRTPKGSFLQMAVISVIPSPKATAKDMVSSTKEYGPELVRLEPDFSPANIQERRSYLEVEAPFIRYFDYADAPGYAMVTVRKDGAVSADLYTGLGKHLWKTVPLTDLLHQTA